MSDEENKDDPYFSSHGAQLQKTLQEIASKSPDDAIVPAAAFIELAAGLIAFRDSLTPLIEVLVSMGIDDNQRRKLAEMNTPLMIFTESIGRSLKLALNAGDDETGDGGA